MRPAVKYIYIVVFALLISGIGILTILNLGRTPKSVFETIEKRKPAEKPIWKWDRKSIDSFFPKYETYINDHFSLRTQLIQLTAYIMLNAGTTVDNSSVVAGKNGFFFLGNKWVHVIDFTTGKRLFTSKELNNFKENFSAKTGFLDSLGIPLYFVIPPNKHSIYPEYLPNNLKRSYKNALQQILKLKVGLEIIGLEKALLSQKPTWKDLLFYKTDTHWTEAGAYFGYREMIKRISVKFPEVQPVILSNENFEIMPYPTGYDMAGMMSLMNHVTDSKMTLINLQGWNFDLKKTTLLGDTITYNALKNPYTMVGEECMMYNPHRPLTVLFFRDSFSQRLSVYLNQTFGRIIYIGTNNPKNDEFKALVEKFRPNMVIIEAVERNLIHYTFTNELNTKANKNERKWEHHISITAKELKRRLKRTNQITDIKVENNEFHFQATGSDPILYLPTIEIPSLKYIKVKVKMNSGSSTNAQLFYLTTGNAHHEEQSVRANVMKGENAIEFVLPEKYINGSKLRFDPGNQPGKYSVSTIEIFVAE
jgi:hypothetical protein